MTSRDRFKAIADAVNKAIEERGIDQVYEEILACAPENDQSPTLEELENIHHEVAQHP